VFPLGQFMFLTDDEGNSSPALSLALLQRYINISLHLCFAESRKELREKFHFAGIKVHSNLIIRFKVHAGHVLWRCGGHKGSSVPCAEDKTTRSDTSVLKSAVSPEKEIALFYMYCLFHSVSSGFQGPAKGVLFIAWHGFRRYFFRTKNETTPVVSVGKSESNALIGFQDVNRMFCRGKSPIVFISVLGITNNSDVLYR
jgi:hypothetical protein